MVDSADDNWLPNHLAEKLFAEIVLRKSATDFDIGTVTDDEEKKMAYSSKVQLYCEAAVLFCLWSVEQKDKRWFPVRQAFEVIIFPRDKVEFDIKHSRIQAAINELKRLVSVERGELLWARDWMLDIGIDVTNPATLAMIGLPWRIQLTTVSLILKDWAPHLG